MSDYDCGPDGMCSMNQEDSDNDNHGDVCDNCPNTSNRRQEDTYPPQGNGLGDACECEGNFDCDADLDGSDAATFKTDYGRNTFSRKCLADDPCKGDFSCDGDVDGTDAAFFKSDFGRLPFQNPCPLCEVEAWCGY